MLKSAFALVLSFSLISTPAFALEESGESLGEALSESTIETSSVVISGSSAAEVSSTVVAVLVTAAAIYLWNAAQTRRAYRRAADEGRVGLSEGQRHPISSAPRGSVLPAVAELERRMAKDPAAAVDEVSLVRAIILRADGMAVAR